MADVESLTACHLTSFHFQRLWSAMCVIIKFIPTVNYVLELSGALLETIDDECGSLNLELKIRAPSKRVAQAAW